MKFTSPRFASLALMFCTSLFFSCSANDLELPEHPDVIFGAISSSGANPNPISSSSADIKVGTLTLASENLNVATATGSVCYENDQANCTKYGRLYTWEAAKTACPSGWRLPTEAEWQTLLAGNSFVAQLTQFGGYGTPDGYFASGNKQAFYWSSTGVGTSMYARLVNIDKADGYVEWSNGEKTDFYSVRCVK